MKRIKTNETLSGLIVKLEKSAKAQKAPIWAAVAEHLAKSTRRRPEIDAVMLSKLAKEGAVVLVPGTVVGAGKLVKPVSVAALRFTAGARSAIMRAGGKCMTLEELLESNKKGTGISIMV